MPIDTKNVAATAVQPTVNPDGIEKLVLASGEALPWHKATGWPSELPAPAPGGAPVGPGSSVAAKPTQQALGMQAAAWSPIHDVELGKLYPTLAQLPPEYVVKPQPPLYMVNGEARVWNGPTRDVISPMRINVGGKLQEIVVGREALLSAGDAAAIAQAAYEAAPKWAKASVAERIACVEKFLAMISSDAQVKETRVLLSLEISKTEGNALAEITRTVEETKAAIALWRDELSKPRLVKDPSVGWAEVSLEPVGPIMVQGPSNYPINETIVDALRALLAGNPVILRSTKYGMCALQSYVPAMAACFPPGVFTYLPGRGEVVGKAAMGAHWVDNQGSERAYVRRLLFIGGDKGANELIRASAEPAFVDVIAHTVAKNPAIVMPGADIPKTVAAIMRGKFDNGGKRCTAEDGIIVHESIFDAFVAEAAKQTDALKMGVPSDPKTQQTMTYDADDIRNNVAIIQDAVKKGAKVMNKNGGACFETFMRPTVLAPCTPEMAVMKYSIFGNVMAVMPYKNESEIFDFAKKSGFGQQASVWGPAEAATSLAKRVDFAQKVNVNLISKRVAGLPFGGRFHNGILDERAAFQWVTIPKVLTSSDPNALAPKESEAQNGH